MPLLKMLSKAFPILFVGLAAISVAYGFRFQVSARNLPNLDRNNGQPDPQLVVYYSPNSTASYQDVASSVIHLNDNNPDFGTLFTVNDNGGNEQTLKIDIYDYEGDQPNPTDGFSYLGFAIVNLSEILNSEDGVVTDLSAASQGQIMIKRYD